MRLVFHALTPIKALMRLLSSLLLAFALLVLPVAMVSGSAAATVDTTAGEPNAEAAHCAGSKTPANHEMPKPGLSCAVACAAACAAFPALSPSISDPLEPANLLLSRAPQKPLAAIALEGETPPPRMTPRI